jgi:hypothetical protein
MVSGQNETRYSHDDPNILRFAHYCAISCNPNIKDINAENYNLSVEDSILSGKTMDWFGRYTINRFKDQDYYPFRQSNAKSNLVSFIRTFPTKDNTSIDKILKI